MQKIRGNFSPRREKNSRLTEFSLHISPAFPPPPSDERAGTPWRLGANITLISLTLPTARVNVGEKPKKTLGRFSSDAVTSGRERHGVRARTPWRFSENAVAGEKGLHRGFPGRPRAAVAGGLAAGLGGYALARACVRARIYIYGMSLYGGRGLSGSWPVDFFIEKVKKTAGTLARYGFLSVTLWHDYKSFTVCIQATLI